jgi:hypothetical protein
VRKEPLLLLPRWVVASSAASCSSRNAVLAPEMRRLMAYAFASGP